MQSPIELLLYSNYIKYDKLEQLVNAAFAGSTADTVDIFIDIHSLIKSLYTMKNDKYIIQDYSIITSSFINLCAHLRYYFRSRHRVETNIFLVYSRNTGEGQNIFYHGYNAKWNTILSHRPDLTEFIERNIDIMETLCPYLNNIFLIRSNNEPHVVIFDRICKNEMTTNFPSIIISKDPVMFNLASLRTNNNIAIFRPKKYEGTDCSYFVNYSNLWDAYVYETRNALLESDSPLRQLNPNMISLLMAMTNIPSRSMKSIYNINKATSIIKDLIDGHYISNIESGPITIGVLQSISNKIQIKAEGKTTYEYNIINRFKAIDTAFQQSIYMNTAESADERYMIRKIDNIAVQNINNEYFVHNPLDLNRL